MTIDSLIDEYLFWCEYVKKQSPDTLEDKGYRLRQFAREASVTTLEHLTNRAAEDFTVKMCMRGLKPSTINKRLNSIVVFAKWLHENRNLQVPLIASNVIYQKEDRRRPTYYTREDIELVLRRADLWEKFAISLMFDTGGRLSEILSIRLGMLRGRKVNVIGKGGKERTLCMTDATRDLLDDYIEAYNITDWLFPSQYGKCRGKRPMSKNTMRVRTAKAFKRCGFDDYYPHALRHSSATDCQLHEAPIDDIRAFLGHSDTRTTQVYLHRFDVMALDRYDKYHRPLKLA